MIMYKAAVVVAGLVAFPALGFALEANPSGQLQAQVTYNEPEIANDARWLLTMPMAELGVTVVEPLQTSTLIGQVTLGFEPLQETGALSLTPEEVYLSWRQAAFNLWAGRLPTLEKAYLHDLYGGLNSVEDKGLGIAEFYERTENGAIRVDVASGEYTQLSAQWEIDETAESWPWSLAAAISTNEGTLSVTYRNNPEGAGIWGNQLSWKSGNSVLSGAWMYQEGVLAWDTELRVAGQSSTPFISYGIDGDENTRWAGGITQYLTEAVTNYSEVLWWPEDERWAWSTGFKLQF